MMSDNPNPSKSVEQAKQWAKQSLQRLDWLITHGVACCSKDSLLIQVGIIRDEQSRLLAVLDDPDAD